MNTKDVKIGETHKPLRFDAIISMHGTAPKYDPCRLFKKGDRVEPTFWNGRPPVASELRANSEFLPHDGIYTVLSDERNSIAFIDYHGKSVFIPVNHLELVTPVEELESYNVKLLQDGVPPDTYHYWAVMDDMGHEVARFWCEQYEAGKAKAAAEAECARLNAEYRKEQE